MVGTLQDVPDYQMPLHLDGTVWLWRAPNAVDNAYRDITDQLVFTQDNGPHAYTFGNGLGLNENHEFTIVFPEARNLTNYYIGVERTSHGGAAYTPTGNVQVSTDTTDGTDGTWSSLTAFADNDALANEHRSQSRTEIVSISPGSAVKGVRFTYLRNSDASITNIEFHCLHLYGTYDTGANDKRLAFWDATLDQAVPPEHFDLGDQWRDSTVVKTFRIKNLSTTNNASGVVLSATSLSDGMADTIEFADSGGVWTSELTVGNIATDTITTETFSMRRVVPSNAPVQPQICYIQAKPDSWS